MLWRAFGGGSGSVGVGGRFLSAAAGLGLRGGGLAGLACGGAGFDGEARFAWLALDGGGAAAPIGFGGDGAFVKRVRLGGGASSAFGCGSFADAFSFAAAVLPGLGFGCCSLSGLGLVPPDRAGLGVSVAAGFGGLSGFAGPASRAAFPAGAFAVP